MRIDNIGNNNNYIKVDNNSNKSKSITQAQKNETQNSSNIAPVNNTTVAEKRTESIKIQENLANNYAKALGENRPIMDVMLEDNNKSTNFNTPSSRPPDRIVGDRGSDKSNTNIDTSKIAQEIVDNLVEKIRDTAIQGAILHRAGYSPKEIAEHIADLPIRSRTELKIGNMGSAFKQNAILNAITAPIDFMERVNEGKSVQRAAIETAGSTVGSIAGSVLLSAAVGAAIGSVIPGPGTAIGFVVGLAIGLAGGTIGGYLGEKAASWIADSIGITG